jgi:tRNA A58 N-methylase Trm61
MDQVEKMSFDLPGGVHPLPRDEIHLLIEHLNVKEGDSFWEIGVGVPFLAFALSAAANGGVVLATDLRKFI